MRYRASGYWVGGPIRNDLVHFNGTHGCWGRLAHANGTIMGNEVVNTIRYWPVLSNNSGYAALQGTEIATADEALYLRIARAMFGEEIQIGVGSDDAGHFIEVNDIHDKSRSFIMNGFFALRNFMEYGNHKGTAKLLLERFPSITTRQLVMFSCLFHYSRNINGDDTFNRSGYDSAGVSSFHAIPVIKRAGEVANHHDADNYDEPWSDGGGYNHEYDSEDLEYKEMVCHIWRDHFFSGVNFNGDQFITGSRMGPTELFEEFKKILL